MRDQKIPENCKLLVPPILNPEMEAALSEYCIERDRQLQGLQTIIGLSLAAIGDVLTNVFSTPKDGRLDRQFILSGSCSAANILLSAYYDMSLHRKRIITAKQGVLAKLAPNQPIDSFLFGSELKEKIKSAEELKKIAKSLIKPAHSSKPKSSKASGKTDSKKQSCPFNYQKSTYDRRKLSGQNKHTSGTRRK